MVMWNIFIFEGTEMVFEFVKKLPKGVLPPSYVNDINCVSFIPLVGEFERINVDEELNTATYEKLQFFGG